MKHGTLARQEPLHRFPEFADMRRFFDTLPTWFSPFEAIRVEEECVDDTFVVRAELPGIDPDKDADVWLDNGMLHVKAERRFEEREDHDGSFRTEFSYGSFHRAVAVPKGVTADDVTATYKDGVLEVRMPMKKAEEHVNKVTIAKG